ncbi:MAG: DUF3786 domain-containing protein [Desulfosarcinaceae bacterium]
MQQAAVFNEIYANYLAEVAALDRGSVAARLGLDQDGDAILVPFYGSTFRVSGEGVADELGFRPSHAVSVILCKHLLLCPTQAPPSKSEWVRYSTFKDALPFAAGFRNTAERPIGRTFAGRLNALREAATSLGGASTEAPFSCDLGMRLPALPTVPLLMMFDDLDEEFPAQCSLLFQDRAPAYLDMECLAMLGMVLASWLEGKPTPGDDYPQGDFE